MSLFAIAVNSQISETKHIFSHKKLLTDEVSHGLQRLLLAHQHPNPLLLAIAHKFRVAHAALFPLVVSEPVKFYPHFKDALQILGIGLNLNLGNVDLSTVIYLSTYSLLLLFILVLDVVLFGHNGFLSGLGFLGGLDFVRH